MIEKDVRIIVINDKIKILENELMFCNDFTSEFVKEKIIELRERKERILMYKRMWNK